MNKRKLGYIVGVSLFSLSIICAAIPLCHFETSNSTYSSWMKDTSDDTLLSEMMIPGTHDSGAMLSIYDVAGKCQDISIKEQLNLGARYLDIRLQNRGNVFYVYHGFINEELYFSDILNTTYSFLETNPSETVIFSIKEERNSSGASKTFDTLLKETIETNSDKWFIENSVPTLGQVRGKIVLMSRYEGNTIGIDSYDGWEDSTTFDMDNGVPMHVQDFYRLENNEAKYESIIDCIEYSNSDTLAWTINFFSGYINNKIMGISLANALTTSTYINPLMIDYFKDANNVRPKGILVIDYYNLEIAEAILS